MQDNNIDFYCFEIMVNFIPIEDAYTSRRIFNPLSYMSIGHRRFVLEIHHL